MSVESVTLDACRLIRRLRLPEKPAVVFDIDDTLIYSLSDRVVKPVHDLFECVKNLGITPVIVTYRSKLAAQYTIKQLYRLGIDGYKLIYFRPSLSIDPWRYKAKARADVASQGYTVIMSVGDQEWDIRGQHTGVGVKIRV